MDAQKVKMINKWDIKPDAQKDVAITALITHYAEVAGDYCHRQFDKPYPSKLQEFIAKMIAFHNPGLSSRSMGSVSYSFDNEHEEKLYKLIKPFRKLNWGG